MADDKLDAEMMGAKSEEDSLFNQDIGIEEELLNLNYFKSPFSSLLTRDVSSRLCINHLAVNSKDHLISVSHSQGLSVINGRDLRSNFKIVWDLR